MAKSEIAEAFTREDDETFEDVQLRERAKSMNIKRYVPEAKPGKYDDEVRTLAETNERTGFENSIEILVPSEDQVKKYKRWFTQSAAAIDKGARIVNGETGTSQGEGGGRLLEFVLTDKRHPKPRTPKVPQTEDADTPVPA